MKLTFDLPIGYNDNSSSDVARLYVQVRNLVDELNRILSNLSEENLSESLREKLRTTSRDSQKALKLAKEAIDAVNGMKGGEQNVSAVDEVLSEDT